MSLRQWFGLGGGAPAQQRENMPAFTEAPGSKAKPDSIGPEDFDAGRAYVANREYQLAYFETPRNEIITVQDLPMRLFLKAKVTGAGTNDAATSEQIDLGSAHSLNAIRSTRAAPSLPSSAHPDVVAFTTTDGGTTYTQQNITAYDASANTVTIAKPANTAYDYKIYVLTGNGQVRITADAPQGSGELQVQLANTTLAALHEVDQSRANAAQTLNGMFGRVIRLSQKFRIGIYVTTDVEVAWATEAEHEVSIPTVRRAVIVNDDRATVRSTLQKLGV